MATSNLQENWREAVFSGFSPTDSNAWLWFFITIFMVVFTGNQLVNAAISQSILNLRVVNSLYVRTPNMVCACRISGHYFIYV